MKVDVSVTLPGDPAWLRACMGHDGSADLCHILMVAGAHEGAFRLCCGCPAGYSEGAHSSATTLGTATEDEYALPCGTLPPPMSPSSSPSLPLPSPAPPSSAPPRSWPEYYSWRGLDSLSPLALLLTFPLTVYWAIRLARLEAGPKPSASSVSSASAASTVSPPAVRAGLRPLHVHLLGPEKELHLLPLFGELAYLLPSLEVRIRTSEPSTAPRLCSPSLPFCYPCCVHSST